MSATKTTEREMTMTEYIHEVSLKTVDDVLNLASAEGYAIETFEGVLNDLHIIYDCDGIRLGSRRGYSYIVCYYTYASSNHNDLHILLTDDFDLVTTFIP